MDGSSGKTVVGPKGRPVAKPSADLNDVVSMEQ